MPKIPKQRGRSAFCENTERTTGRAHYLRPALSKHCVVSGNREITHQLENMSTPNSIACDLELKEKGRTETSNAMASCTLIPMNTEDLSC